MPHNLSNFGYFLTLGSKQSDRRHSSIDERQFMRDLHQNTSNRNFRTSSPVNFRSFLQSSVVKNAEEAQELQSQADVFPSALGLTFYCDFKAIVVCFLHIFF